MIRKAAMPSTDTGRLPERLTDMEDEKLERFKEFMVQQQAQSAEKLLQLEDLLVRFVQATRERFAENERRTQGLDEKFAVLLDAQIRAEDRATESDREAKERAAESDREAKARAADFDRKIAALVDAQMRTEETVNRMGERIDKLGERIDKLTVVVERHVSDGHGGRARPEG